MLAGEADAVERPGHLVAQDFKHHFLPLIEFDGGSINRCFIIEVVWLVWNEPTVAPPEGQANCAVLRCGRQE